MIDPRLKKKGLNVDLTSERLIIGLRLKIDHGLINDGWITDPTLYFIALTPFSSPRLT